MGPPFGLVYETGIVFYVSIHGCQDIELRISLKKRQKEMSPWDRGCYRIEQIDNRLDILELESFSLWTQRFHGTFHTRHLRLNLILLHRLLS